MHAYSVAGMCFVTGVCVCVYVLWLVCVYVCVCFVTGVSAALVTTVLCVCYTCMHVHGVCVCLCECVRVCGDVDGAHCPIRAYVCVRVLLFVDSHCGVLLALECNLRVR